VLGRVHVHAQIVVYTMDMMKLFHKLVLVWYQLLNIPTSLVLIQFTL